MSSRVNCNALRRRGPVFEHYGHTEVYRGAECEVQFLPKLKLEIAIPDNLLDGVIEAVENAARTGKVGDGKIFVVDPGQTIRVRTAKTGEAAL